LPDPNVRVSFLTSLYNCLGLTQGMVASLQATVRDLEWEALLVDDGSTDDTRTWLGTLGDPRIRVLLNPTNLGYAASNNRAAGAATGDVLVLLNNDLVLRPGWLEPLLEGLGRLHRPGFIGNVQVRASDGRIDHAGVVFDAIGRPRHLSRLGLRGRLQDYSRRSAVTAACCAIGAGVFRSAGGFDEAYRNGYEDVDLCLRLARSGFRHYVANRSVVVHHVSASPDRFAAEAPNLRLHMQRWGRAPSLRHRGIAYLQRYGDQPWRYNGGKLVLALAWCITNRELPGLRRWLGVDIPPPHEPPRA
jgi:GT2 family glycosyltransferase